jgi:hypothetical protein
MKDSLSNLIKVKSIVTFIAMAVWAVLSLRGVILPEWVNNLVLLIIGFYFGTQKVNEKSGD